jgi:hypothetical protein
MTLARSPLLLAVAAFAVLAAGARATAPPIGPLPAGPTSTVATQHGELVAIALPHRPQGRVWRIATPANAKILTEVTEADVGASVVTIFRALRPGSTTLRFALTRGERAHVYESRTFVIRVS